MSIRDNVRKGKERLYRWFVPPCMALALGLTAGIALFRHDEAARPAVKARVDQALLVAHEGMAAPDAYIGVISTGRYYFPWCGALARVKSANRAVFESREEAEAAGYLPAGNCAGISSF